MRCLILTCKIIWPHLLCFSISTLFALLTRLIPQSPDLRTPKSLIIFMETHLICQYFCILYSFIKPQPYAIQLSNYIGFCISSALAFTAFILTYIFWHWALATFLGIPLFLYSLREVNRFGFRFFPSTLFIEVDIQPLNQQPRSHFMTHINGVPRPLYFDFSDPEIRGTIMAHLTIMMINRRFRELTTNLPFLEIQNNEEGRACPVCLEVYRLEERVTVLPGCMHMYHKGCLEEWMRREPSCPVC